MLDHAPALAGAAAASAEVDCLLALARGARQLNLRRPTLTADNVLHIKNGACAVHESAHALGDSRICPAAGRHLLQEQTVEVFVPNDTRVGAHDGRINIVTGPNFSGKSVYLVRCHASCAVPAQHPGALAESSDAAAFLQKQVAIIVFLAHVGSFVPADSATVGLTDRIFTRVATTESLSAIVAQSAFMCDTHQVREGCGANAPRGC